MFEYFGNTFVIIAYLVFEMFCQVCVIIRSAHRNMMELGKLTWKTHTFLRPDVITKGGLQVK
jgi:hypothetical protein